MGSVEAAISTHTTTTIGQQRPMTAFELAGVEAQLHAIQVSARTLAAAVSTAGTSSTSNATVREHLSTLQAAVAAVTTLLTDLGLLDSSLNAMSAVATPVPAADRPVAVAPTTSCIRRSLWDKLSPELKHAILALAGPVTQYLSGVGIQPLRAHSIGADRDRTRSAFRDIFEHDLHHLLIDPRETPTPAAAAAATAAHATFNFAAVLKDGMSLKYPDYLLIRSRLMFTAVQSTMEYWFERELFPVAVARGWQDLLRHGPCGECPIEARDVARSGLPLHRVAGLFAAQPKLSIDNDFIDYAACVGRMDLLRWADVFKPFETHVGTPLQVAGVAAASGHLHVVEWALNRFGMECVAGALDTAAARGHLALVEFLHERGAEATVAAMDGAAENGHIDVVKFLHDRGAEATVAAMDRAAENGHFDVVKFLHSHRTEGCTKEALYGVLEFTWTEDRVKLNKGAELVKFLLEHRPEVADIAADIVYIPILQCLHVLPRACLEIIQVLHRLSSKDWSDPAVKIDLPMDLAAGAGLLDVLEFLHSNRNEGCTEAAVNTAAAGGHLAVVKFLNEHFGEVFTATAMDEAAAAGHLDIVEFLHEQRTEGCSKVAMDAAAGNGHLDVVRYLHMNRKEGCSKQAMDVAAERGYLEVVKFLHDNRSEGCSHDAATGAFRKGHLDVVEFLGVTYGLTPEGLDDTKFWTDVIEEQMRSGDPGVHLLPLQRMPVASMAAAVVACTDAAQRDHLAFRCVQLELAKHLEAVLETTPDVLAAASLEAVVGNETLQLWGTPTVDVPEYGVPEYPSRITAAANRRRIEVLKTLCAHRPALFSACGAVTALMESCVRHLCFSELLWLWESFPEPAAAHPMFARFRPALGMLVRGEARSAAQAMDIAVSKGSLDTVVWLRHCFGGMDAALDRRAAALVEHEAWRHISMGSELGSDSSSMREDI